MNPVRIAFVGVGGMGQCAHLHNYVSRPDCDVVAVAELREGLGRAVAARWGVPRVYKSHEELLTAGGFDGIVASQPFTRHGVLLPDLFAAGVPVFSEKPIASAVATGERIAEASSKLGVVHMVGYHKRSDLATEYAVAEIDRLRASGELGKLRYVRITMPAGDWIASGFTHLLRTDDPTPPLSFDPPADDMSEEVFSEYVSFVNYYIHQVNLLRFLLREPYRFVFVDQANTLLAAESESGITGTIEMSPYHTTVDWQEEALVCFERGTIRLALPAPLANKRPGRVEVYRDPGDGATPMREEPALPWVHAMRNQATRFLEVCRGEREPPCAAPEALEDLKAAREYIRLRFGA